MAVAHRTMDAINPATGQLIERYNENTPQEVEEALGRARQAFAAWRDRSFEERGRLMHRAADYLRNESDRLAGLITAEMGKPISEARAEIKKCAWNCDYYADHAAEFMADEPVQTNARESLVAFEPLGTVLAIMPWNFPFWQVFRFAAPALMAGNVAVLKHASNVPGCALTIEEVFRASGFPDGTFRTLLLSSSAIDRIIHDRRIAAVTLTGSSEAGRTVASAAGDALKKTVLELGGSDPFIVLEDADLDGAVEFAVKARFQNTGQSCIAAKRFIVVEAVADEFERRFIAAVERLRVDDPTDPGTQVGPLAREDLLDGLERQVRESVDAGAHVATGGKRLDRSGYFYTPTVITGVTPDMPVFREETFGPVAAVIRVSDAGAAVATANDSEYGLGGNLWTRDTERGKVLARRIESGNVFINGMTASDPRLPFGGVKDSGYGRELSSFGIREFLNIQTIWVGPADGEQATSPAE
jgi:succinate-semialdehyde dehydrogenase / glutarate-semialdehyde dehydrogenase